MGSKTELHNDFEHPIPRLGFPPIKIEVDT
jgi:hypothetical protein